MQRGGRKDCDSCVLRMIEHHMTAAAPETSCTLSNDLEEKRHCRTIRTYLSIKDKDPYVHS